MRRLRFVILATAFAVLFAGWSAGPAHAQAKRVYAVKFVCGRYVQPPAYPEGPVKPGNYQTAVNIHNPQKITTVFYKKAVVLFNSSTPPASLEQPRPPGPIKSAVLQPDWGMEVDCIDIRQALIVPPVPVNGPFIKGFVVFEVYSTVAGQLPPELDVVAAYTSHTFSSGTIPEGFDTDVAYVQGKLVQ